MEQPLPAFWSRPAAKAFGRLQSTPGGLPTTKAIILTMHIVTREIAKRVFFRRFEPTRAGRPWRDFSKAGSYYL
jgi:hypothetical protein